MKKTISIICIVLSIVIISSLASIEQVYGVGLSYINVGADTSVAYDGNASVAIQRSGDSSNVVTVYYRTINGSAIGGTHFTAKTGSVTFTAGQTSKNLIIDTKAFNTWETENRFFFVEIYKVTGNAVKNYDKDICRVTINHKDTINMNGLNAWYAIYASTADHHYESNNSYYTPVKSITGYDYWVNQGCSIIAQFNANIKTSGSNIRLFVGGTNTNNTSYEINAYNYFGSEDGGENSGSLTVTGYDYILGRGQVDDAEDSVFGVSTDYGEINDPQLYLKVSADTTKPTIQTIHVVGNTSEPYSDGDNLYISVRFDEIVNVAGGPAIQVKFSDNTVTKASYVGGAGTDTLVFKLVIPKGKASTGLYFLASDSFYGESYVKDIAGNTMNIWNYSACINGGVKIVNNTPIVSTISADKSNVSLNSGDIVNITINYSEPVMVTGTPYLTLNTGKSATLTSGTGAYVLSSTFKYTIASTENISALGISALSGGTITDRSGNALTRTIDTNNIKTNNIKIDNDVPDISINPNGNLKYEKSQSATMSVTDTTNGTAESGVANVKYVWNTSTATPSYAAFTQTGGNNMPASISGITGSRYLHIRAVDVAGNVRYYNSPAFKLDNTSPSITINGNGGTVSKSHTASISLSDSHAGINSNENFKYLWNTSSSQPSESDFNSATSGSKDTNISKNTGDGKYYLHIRAKDNAGNTSYKNSSSYDFDNTPPSSIIVTTKDSSGTNTDSDSNKKLYKILLSASDSHDGSITNIKYRWSDGSQTISSGASGWISYTNQFSYDNVEKSGLKYLHIVAEDTAGNYKYITKIYTFDYTSPNIEVTSSDLSGIHGDLTSNIEVSDIQNSIKTFKYIWRDNNTINITDGTWMNGTLTGYTGIGNPTKDDESGSWYLHVYCEDIVGNYGYNITGPYVLDVTGPTGSISIQETSINDGKINMILTATDNIPENTLKYSISQDNSTWSEWNLISSPMNINGYTIASVEEGVTTIYVKFMDASGNTSQIYTDTVRIDITPPTANLSYNPGKSGGWTNFDVVSTLIDLIDNLGEVVSTPLGSEYKFTSNGTHLFEIVDKLGNSAQVTAVVDWIDKISPTIAQIAGNQTPQKEHSGVINVTDDITGNINGVAVDIYYQWTQSNTIPASDDVNWISALNGTTIVKNAVNGNWYLHIKAIDEAGNNPVNTSGKFTFDNLPPSGGITIPDDFKFIKNNIINLQLNISDNYSSNKEIKYSLSNDNLTWSDWSVYVDNISDYQASFVEGENTVYVKFMDKLGNESITYSDTFDIDKEAPTGALVYSLNKEDGYTNNDIVATIINLDDNNTSSEDITVDDTYSNTYVFTKNETHIFILKDEVGNTAEIAATVDWIDKTDPVISQISGNQTPKKQYSAILTAVDNISGNISDKTIEIYYQWSNSINKPELNDGNWISKSNGDLVIHNGVDGDWYLHVKAIDEAGNDAVITSGKFVFDNTAPMGSLVIGEEYKFIKNNIVQLNLEASDSYSNSSEIKYALSNDGVNWSEWKQFTDMILAYEASYNEGQNIVYVKYKDKLENISLPYSDSFVIDKSPPTGVIEYSWKKTEGYTNNNVTATVINLNDNNASVENITVDGGNYNTFTFMSNGSHIFILRDEVGNQTELEAKVDWIDKTKPIISQISGNQTPAREHNGIISATDDITGSMTDIQVAVWYKWDQSSANPGENDLNWLSATNGEKLIKGEVSGEWYLHIKAQDEAGNITITTSGIYKFDNTAPSGNIEINGEYKFIKENIIQINLDALDNYSNTSLIEYSISNDNVNWSQWKVFENIVENYAASNNEGENTVYVKYRDELGNIGSVCSDFFVIDKTPPSGELEYSFVKTDGYTKSDVIARVVNLWDNNTSTENIKVDDTDSHTYVFSSNETHIFVLKDEVGNTAEIVATVDWIDKTDPIIAQISGNQTPKKEHSATLSSTDNITGSISNETISTYYQWSDAGIEPSSSDENWLESINGGKVYKNGVDGDWCLYVKAIDEAGNESIITSGVFVFDNTAPSGSMVIDTGQEYKFIKDNIVTLDFETSDEYSSTSEIQYSLSNDGSIWSEWKPFTDMIINYEASYNDGINTVYVKYRDKLGNTSDLYTDSFQIDKTPPSGEIEYSLAKSNGYTNNSVIARVVNLTDDHSAADMITVDGGNSNTYTFTDNDTHNFVLKDAAGNESEIQARVDWIDKTGPQIDQISGNQTPAKEHSGIVSASDDITGSITDIPVSIWYKWDKNSINPAEDDLGWTYTENASSQIKTGVSGIWYLHTKAQDEAGNITLGTSGIYVFDNTAPYGSIEINGEYKFIKDNTIQINLDASDNYSNISLIEYSISNDNMEWSEWKSFEYIIENYVASDNEGENIVYVKYRDALGNTGTIHSDSFVIDKTPPSVELEYSLIKSDGYTKSDVVASLVNIADNYSSEENILINDRSYIFNKNEEYTFTLSDEVGNETQVTANVDWIDKEVPEIQISPNSDQNASKSHIANVLANDNTTTITDIDIEYQWTDNNSSPLFNDENWISLENGENVEVSDYEGDWYLHVKAIDKPGNVKIQTSGKFVLDNSGPQGDISIKEDITRFNKITVNLSANDAVSISGQIMYSLSLDGQNWSSWAILSEIINNYEIPNIEDERIIYVKYKDNLDNESEVYSDSVILDLTGPTYSLNYSDEKSDGYVNSDITVSLSNIADNYSETENIEINESEYIFTSNGSKTFTLQDEVGNLVIVPVVIDYIDKTSPTIESFAGNDNPEKSHSAYIDVSDNVTLQEDMIIKYQWTQNSSQPSIDDNNWKTVVNESTVSKSGLDGYRYLYVVAWDEVGNVSDIIGSRYMFDNTSPVGSVEYSTEKRTAQQVSATLTTDETVMITNPESGSNKYIFDENGTFKFEFEDSAGNTATCDAEVTWIDKDIPSANIIVSTKEWTNDDVELIISVSSLSRIQIRDFDFGQITDYSNIEELTRPMDLDGVVSEYVYESSYSVGENGKIVFEIYDIDTFSVQEIEITIDNIDKISPSYDVSLSNESPTNSDVVISLNEHDNTNLPVLVDYPSDVELSNGQYIVKTNGIYEFTISDNAGNEVDIPVKIENIDKKAPVLNLNFSNNDWTSENVVATLEYDENIEVLNNNGERTYEFTENGSFEFKVKDDAGNENSIIASVSNIDKLLPDADIVYSPTDMTNTDVTVTVTPNEPANIVSVEGLSLKEGSNNEYIAETNGTYHFILVDRADNEQLKTLSITNIDKESPIITYTLSNVEPTNKDVEIFLHGDEIFEVIEVPNSILITVVEEESRYYATDSGKYLFKVIDTAGNIGQVIVNIDNIDLLAPILEVSYDITEWTNSNVKARLQANEYITVKNNGNMNTYVFEENGSFEFVVADLAGNTSKLTATVDNIDKIKPNAELGFDPQGQVNTDVVITIDPDEDMVSIVSLDGLLLSGNSDNMFIATVNGDYSFKLIDKAGNITTKTIKINNIDKEGPLPTYALSTLEATNQDVGIFIFADEAFDIILVPEGIKIVEEEGIERYYADANGSYTFEIADRAGNRGRAVIKIDNIDHELPIMSLEYSDLNWTNKDVDATIIANEPITIKTNDGKATHTFTENGSFIFEVVDNAGNIASITSEVMNIDKNSPNALMSISPDYTVNTDVFVIIEPDEEVEVVSIEGLASVENAENQFIVVENGNYSFELMDRAGNKSSKSIMINNIDKESPEITYTLATMDKTNEDVKIYFKGNESFTVISVPEKIKIIETGDETEYYATESGSYLFVMKDNFGNEGECSVDVENIDLTPPTLSLTYTIEEWTNIDVQVELSADEEIIVKNNDGSKIHNFEKNGSFEFIVSDIAGNISELIASVDNIDKQKPNAEFEFNSEGDVNTDVIITVEPDEDMVSIISLDGLLLEENSDNKFIATINGDYSFELTDKAGNKNIKTVKINNIDREAPISTYSLSTFEPTNQDVEIYIFADEAFEVTLVPDGIKIVESQGTKDRYYASANGSYTFEIVDSAGNEGIALVKIENIDHDFPILTLEYSDLNWTNKNVDVVLSANENISINTNDGKSIYTFTKNGTFIFEVVDDAGNIASITSEVLNIDKNIPNALMSISPDYTVNTDVVLTIEADEEVTLISAEGLKLVENTENQFIIVENGHYSFDLMDRGGNKATKSIMINNIDKESPEITYTLATTDKTNEDVKIYFTVNESYIITLVPEKIKIVETGEETEYYATESGTFIFKMEDDFGNEGQCSVSVENIDLTPPILSLTYSTEEWTNMDVKAELTANEEIIVKTNDGSKIHNFENNESFEFIAEDIAGNTSSIIATVANIDKQSPNASITSDSDTIVNTDIVITVLADENDVLIESEEGLKLKEGSVNSFIAVENGDYSFNLTDKAGNTFTKIFKVNNIDKLGPEMTYTISTEKMTNQDIEIYFYGSEPFLLVSVPEDIMILEESGVYRYYAKESGSYEFGVEDLYKNKASCIVEISNIDLIAPELTVEYSAIELINEDVLATVSANEEFLVLNNNGSKEITFTENGEFTFYVEDMAGNKAEITAETKIIDKIAPSATFIYSTVETTKEDIQVVITSNELLQSLVSDELDVTTTGVAIESEIIEPLLSKEYNIETNGEYHFHLRDIAGNVKDYEIYVTNIDKTPPVLNYTLVYDTPAGIKEVNQDGVIVKGPIITYGDDAAEYQNSLITKNDVLLTFNPSETCSMEEAPDGITIDKDENYVIAANGDYIFYAIDTAGNMGEVVVAVDTIEKKIPKVKLVYSQTEPTKDDVVVTVESTNGDYFRVVNNYNDSQRVFSENGDYTFIIQDYAGNEIEIKATVDNIDRTSPILSLEYSTREYTNENVLVELKANEDIVVLNNGGSKYYNFDSNGEIRFYAKDSIGNTAEIIAVVDYIDKTPPSIEFSGNENLEVLEGQSIDLLEDVSTQNYEDSNLTITVSGEVDINTPGQYTVIYSVTDKAGNSAVRNRMVKVLPADELIVTFNGLTPDYHDYIVGSHFDLNIYNNQGDYKILQSDEKMTKGQIKVKGEELVENAVNIFKSGWYTFFIYDQERNAKFYNIFMIKE